MYDKWSANDKVIDNREPTRRGEGDTSVNEPNADMRARKSATRRISTHSALKSSESASMLSGKSRGLDTDIVRSLWSENCGSHGLQPLAEASPLPSNRLLK